MERQVRYNFRRSKENPEANTWWFLIINDNRGIEIAQKRIYSLLEEIYNEGTNFEGSYPRTKLRYKLLKFDSQKFPKKEDLRKINLRVIQDPNLYDRETSAGLEKYICSLSGK